MEQAEEKLIRDKIAGLVTDWAAYRQPAFTGEKLSEFVDAIAVAHLVTEEAKANLRRWVAVARRAGVSWLDIGRTLGISKQAAQQRYGALPTDENPPGKPARGLILLSAGAANELETLRREGRRGHELIDVTESTLFLRRTKHLWEYKKLVESSLEIHRMPQEGWRHIRDVFPFSYFKRIFPK